MRRSAFIVGIALLATVALYGQATKQRPKLPDTWYEQALRSINPSNTDFGAIWDERKHAIVDQLGNRYFQYSFASTTAIVILLTLLRVQRVSHKRALDVAAQSIADVLRHDEYSRQTAREAIRRYNEHIEACNRAGEARHDGLSKSVSDAEAELHRLRVELADTREENKALRNDIAKKSTAGKTQPAQTGMESTTAQYIARINSLEKQLRDEQRKNHSLKGTSVSDRRS